MLLCEDDDQNDENENGTEMNDSLTIFLKEMRYGGDEAVKRISMFVLVEVSHLQRIVKETAARNLLLIMRVYQNVVKTPVLGLLNQMTETKTLNLQT
ncbi:hypothetical protein PR048_027786 [Dryococelus australis]|uniref:Uncharacterized protein n=1 Tax=Dryococelus australis TaxID=614101 RepID=A0ABQ9GHG7_9NEOP|nr:hypothetical protein PR048_027786 [Dryococelus australis]